MDTNTTASTNTQTSTTTNARTEDEVNESENLEQEQEQEVAEAIKQHFFKKEYKSLTEIPSYLFESKLLKTELEVLYLSNNKISGFPYEICNFENLKVLNMSHNKISSLSEEFMMLTRLIGVDFSYNLLERLPERWLKKLPDLRLLILDHNSLRKMPNSLWTTSSLTHLQMSSNQLSAVPPEIAQLKNLKILHLKGNRLKSLPDEICKLITLEELYLERNNLVELPAQFFSSLINLKQLNTSHNRLVSSEYLASMSSLKDLHGILLGSNRIEILPALDSSMENVSVVDLSNNLLRTFPASISAIGMYVRILDLRNNQITALPQEFKTFTNLEELNVCHNKLISLPKDLGYCRNLRFIRASHNCLQKIHSSCFNCHMTKLVEMHLDFNKLTSLPNTLHLLPDLMEINVEYNQLTELPVDLHQSPKLYGIHASHNRITKIPDNISEYGKLRKLYLADNQIKCVPKSMRKLSTLSFFDLWDNPIIDIFKKEGLEAIIEDDEVTIVPQDQTQVSDQLSSTTTATSSTTKDAKTEEENQTILHRFIYSLLPEPQTQAAKKEDISSPPLQTTQKELEFPTATNQDSPSPRLGGSVPTELSPDEDGEEEERTIETILALPPREYVVCSIQ